MGRCALNLPTQPKREAEHLPTEQGVSPKQHILWAVSEQVSNLKQQADDPACPPITYRRGAAGSPEPALRGSGLRVQAIVAASGKWALPPA